MNDGATQDKLKNKISKRPKTAKNLLWGGRFTEDSAKVMQRINASIEFDKRLFRQDIKSSQAHCDMLIEQNIISEKDGHSILTGLAQIENEITNNELEFSAELEDIHMHVEARLSELIGEAAGRLHTSRSRNDQVATDFRLWIRDEIDILERNLQDLHSALLTRAEEHADTIMPGFTHLQCAQPVTFGHHLMAYVEMLGRDRSRLADCRRRLNESPLGAAALAGTSFPIDREATSSRLDFDRPMANSLDAVSSRDFALEYLAVAAILSTNLSRLSEEIVLWTSAQFRFIALSDAFTSGSSIMPQKRNPDAAEIVRAKVGRVVGDLNALLIVMKGLPLAYSKDMQEDKEPVFEVADILGLTVPAMSGMIRDMKVNETQMREAAANDFSTATDVADWLVQRCNLPFRSAHRITGALIKLAEAKNMALQDLTLEQMQTIEPNITVDIFTVLSIENSVETRLSFGGTAPINVRAAIATAKKKWL